MVLTFCDENDFETHPTFAVKVIFCRTFHKDIGALLNLCVTFGLMSVNSARFQQWMWNLARRRIVNVP